jgi:hypothetical protein
MSYIDYKTKYHKYKTKYLNFIKQNSARQIGGEGEIPIAVVCTHGDRMKCILNEITTIELGEEKFSPCSIVLLKLRKRNLPTELKDEETGKVNVTKLEPSSSTELIFGYIYGGEKNSIKFNFNTPEKGPFANIDADIYLINHADSEEQPWYSFFGLFESRNLPLNENGRKLAEVAGKRLNESLENKKINILGVSDLIRTHQTMEIILKEISKLDAPITFNVLPCNYETEYNVDKCDMESDFTRKKGNIPSVDDYEQLKKKLETELGYKLDYSEYWKTSDDIKKKNPMRHQLDKGVNKCANNKLMMLESVIKLLYPGRAITESTLTPIEPTLTPTEYAHLKITITKEEGNNKKIELKGRSSQLKSSSQIMWDSGATFSVAPKIPDIPDIFNLVFIGINNIGVDSGMSGIQGARPKDYRELRTKKIKYELIDNDGKPLISNSISIKEDKDSEYYFIEINLDKIILKENESTVFRVIAK